MIVADEVVDLDEIVAGFETALANDESADLADYLPPRRHPLYRAALLELVRVDMELAWAGNQQRKVADYLDRFPELNEDAASRHDVCFEEFRLRQQAGDNPDTAEYQSRFQVDTSRWPVRRLGHEDVTASAAAYLKKNQSTAVNQATEVGDKRAAEAPTMLFDELHRTDPTAAVSLAQALTQFPKVGQRFLGFQLLDELGRGAFSRVYLALESAVAGRRVALKVTGDARSEIYALAGLRHTNIIPVFSLQRSEPFQAIVMPHCGQVTFADVVRAVEKEERLPRSGRWIVDQIDHGGETPLLRHLSRLSYVDAVLELAVRLSEGLAHAHEHAVWHRDLKPANILLADDGEPLLLDFNLAEGIGPGGLPVAAYVGGTLPYMAPEQVRAYQSHGPPPDARADVYAFGLILHELLAGRSAYPLPNGKVSDMLDKIAIDRSTAPPNLRTFNADVSPAFASIINKCLDPEPLGRYPTARELAEDLARQRDHQPLRHAPEPSWRERFGKWAKRHPRLASATMVSTVAATIILALGFTVWQVNNSRAELAQRDNLRQFQTELQQAKIALSAAEPDHELLKNGLLVAHRAWGRLANQDAALPVERGTLAYLLARSEWQQSFTAESDEDRLRHRGAATEWNRRAQQLFGNTPQAPAATAQAARISDSKAQPGDASELGADDYLAALALIDQHKPREAHARLEQATRNEPDSLPPWYARGLVAQTLGKNEVAVECFSACVALGPQTRHGYHGRAMSMKMLGRMKAALIDMNKAVELEPESLSARLDRGLVFMELKKYAEAETDVTAAIDGGFPETRLYFLRARIRDRAGDKKGAADDRAKGFDQRPNCETDWVAQARARLPRDPQAAMSDLNECTKRYPKSQRTLAWDNKAMILSEYLHQPEDAIAALAEAVRIDPDAALSYAGRGVLYARQGNFTAARDDAQKALALRNDPEVVYHVAGIYALTAKETKSDRDRALFLLSRAIHHDYGVDLIDGDPELATLKPLPEVQRLIIEAKKMREFSEKKGG